MSSAKYAMSFTTGGLFYGESMLLLKLYDQMMDWEMVSNEAFKANMLQSRVESTAKRILREITGRLKTLNEEELKYIKSASVSEQKYILWLSICRKYKFIYQFASEVLRERYVTMKLDLPATEFESFYDTKEQWHAELEKIKPSTKAKLRTVLYKMLREAEIIDGNNFILPTMLTDDFIRMIAKKDVNDLMVFPISDTDLQRAMQ